MHTDDCCDGYEHKHSGSSNAYNGGTGCYSKYVPATSCGTMQNYTEHIEWDKSSAGWWCPDCGIANEIIFTGTCSGCGVVFSSSREFCRCESIPTASNMNLTHYISAHYEVNCGIEEGTLVTPESHMHEFDSCYDFVPCVKKVHSKYWTTYDDQTYSTSWTATEDCFIRINVEQDYTLWSIGHYIDGTSTSRIPTIDEQNSTFYYCYFVKKGQVVKTNIEGYVDDNYVTVTYYAVPVTLNCNLEHEHYSRGGCFDWSMGDYLSDNNYNLYTYSINNTKVDSWTQTVSYSETQSTSKNVIDADTAVIYLHNPNGSYTFSFTISVASTGYSKTVSLAPGEEMYITNIPLVPEKEYNYSTESYYYVDVVTIKATFVKGVKCSATYDVQGYNLNCDKTEGEIYAPECSVPHAICEKIIIKLEPNVPIQELEINEVPDVICTATFLDGHQELVECEYQTK